MKHEIFTKVIAGVLASSASVAFAAGVALTSGSSTTVDIKNGTDPVCDVLQSRVTVGLSTNVFGAYDCREAGAAAGGSTPAAIGVATCHKAGLVKERSFQCDPATGASNSAINSACVQAADGSWSGTYTAAGAGMFNAISTGGAVIAAPIALCDSSDTVAGAIEPIVDAAIAALTQ